MNTVALRELIHHGENSGVEFKRDALDACSLAKEIVAFANFAGGRVLIGVEDDGSISGISRPELEQWVMNVCRDKIRPEIIPYVTIMHDVQPGRSVAIVQVERGLHVHHLWHDQHRTYYIRVGSQSREASPEELARLFQQRGSLRSELQPVSGSSIDDLDLRRLTEYFRDIRQQDFPPPTEREAWIQLLTNTEFLVPTDGHTPATVAGLLLFGHNPNRFLPQAGIDAAVYKSNVKDYDTDERLYVRGPMVRYGVENLPTDNGHWETLRAFFQRHLSYERLDDLDRRVRVWDIPADVLREGIINALAHRDYLLSATTIEVSIYSDRVEIVSPGRLPNGINPQRMAAGCRAARNQLLKDTLRDYGYMEHMGLGVPRKIIRGMLRHNGTHPALIPAEEQFTLALHRSART
jgi:ATP-dependent DNA helicase RecG